MLWLHRYDFAIAFETFCWECGHEMNASVNDTRIVKEHAPTLVLRSGRATNHKSISDDAQRPLEEHFLWRCRPCFWPMKPPWQQFCQISETKTSAILLPKCFERGVIQGGLVVAKICAVRLSSQTEEIFESFEPRLREKTPSTSNNIPWRCKRKRIDILSAMNSASIVERQMSGIRFERQSTGAFPSMMR